MTQLRIQPATKPLSGAITAPGDKSIGHRAVMLGALADGEVRITGLGRGADNRATARALKQLGVEMREQDGTLIVVGAGRRGLRAPESFIDCGNSGTSMRLLCGLLAAQPFLSRLTGDASLQRRPMKRIVEPLRLMGADIEGDTAPLTIRPVRKPLRGIEYVLPVASAQVKSALLLAGLYADGRTTLTEPGPSRDHTERMLRYLGAPVLSEPGGVTRLDPTGWEPVLDAKPIHVPGDPSSAAFAVVAALLAGGDPVTVEGVCINPTRTGFIDALRIMGAAVTVRGAGNPGGEPVGDLVVERGAGEPLSGATIEGALVVRCIDEIPILAVAAAAAEGVTWFRDVAELRVKESDRIATTAAMLRAFGIEVDEQPDAFAVHGRGGAPFTPAIVDAAGDHRIAMAAAVAGLRASGESRVDDAANVATSYPGFVDAMRSLGADITD